MIPASGWHVDSNTLSYFTLCNTECRRDVIKNIYIEREYNMQFCGDTDVTCVYLEK